MSQNTKINFNDVINSIKINIGTTEIPYKTKYCYTPEKNPVRGDIYFDTNLQTLRFFNGAFWKDISYDKDSAQLFNQFDIITEKEGFLKVKLYQSIINESRGLQILNENDEILINEISQVIKFIKDNVPEIIYLWIEKRIFDYLS